MAKPLANGYPIGAVLLRASVASTMTPGKCDFHLWNGCSSIHDERHQLTFGVPQEHMERRLVDLPWLVQLDTTS